jgi:drug/metabolite transporter (DMT)-like permease
VPVAMPVTISVVHRRNLLVAACAFSAGVHLAITPEHLSEMPPIGVSFIVATVALAVTVGALIRFPESRWPPLAAAALFVGMIVAYALTRAMAIPGLEETPEAVDVVGVITKVVELGGLALAVSLLVPPLRSAQPAVREGVEGISRAA